VAFTDALPAGVQVAAVPNVNTSGCGSPTFTPVAADTTLTFSGGTIAASGSCTVSVDVTATISGTKDNVSGAVTSTNGGTGNTGSATLTVPAAPGIAKAFNPTAIAPRATSILSFTITNSNTSTVLTGVAFTDGLPSGLQVAATPNVSTTGCGSPTFAPVAADTTLTFSGGMVAASGTCTVRVDVTATSAGVKNNTTGTVTSAEGGTGNTGSATLTITTAINPVTELGTALAGTAATPIANVAANDTVNGAAATLGASGNATVAQSGVWPTGIALDTTTGAITTTAAVPAGVYSITYQLCDRATPANCLTMVDTVTVVGPPSIGKSFTPVSVIVTGTSTLSFTIANANTSTVLTGVAFTDALPAGLQVAATPNASASTGCGSPTFAPAAGSTSLSFLGGTITASGSCMVNVAVTATSTGTKNNTTGNVTSTNGGTGNTGSASLSVGQLFDPPSGRKTFNANLLPELEWRIVWINSANISTINVQISDPIPAGTTYVAGSFVCTPTGTSTTTTCTFDSVNNRVFWQGTIGPDPGATDEATAANEVVLSFRVSVPSTVDHVTNQATSLTDRNGDGSFADETSGASVSTSNIVVWDRQAATEIPALSMAGLAFIGLFLSAAGWLLLRRQGLGG
jgi:uncharacterized repeat protein (TIGR01451 family)